MKLDRLALHYFAPQHHPNHQGDPDFILDKLNLSSLSASAYEAAVNEDFVAEFGERVAADAGVSQFIVTKIGDGPEITKRASSFRA